MQHDWMINRSFDPDDTSWDPNDDIDPAEDVEIDPFDYDDYEVVFFHDEDDPDDKWCQSLERPHHGRRQIRTPRGIKVGMRLRMWNKDYCNVVVVKRAPYLREEEDSESLSFDYVSEGRDFIHTTYLVDQGVKRYDHGYWNTANWLERLK